GQRTDAPPVSEELISTSLFIDTDQLSHLIHFGGFFRPVHVYNLAAKFCDVVSGISQSVGSSPSSYRQPYPSFEGRLCHPWRDAFDRIATAPGKSVIAGLNEADVVHHVTVCGVSIKRQAALHVIFRNLGSVTVPVVRWTEVVLRLRPRLAEQAQQMGIE